MMKFFEDGKIPQDKILRFEAIYHEVGPIGAARSHLGVLKLAKESGWNRVLILEDDVVWNNFDETYTKLCELVETPAWDVCMLGGIYVDKDPPKIHAAFAGYSYIVSSHYYDALIENIESCLTKRFAYANSIQYSRIRTMAIDEERSRRLGSNWYAFDVYWMKLQQTDNWIGLELCNHDYSLPGNVAIKEYHNETPEGAVVTMKGIYHAIIHPMMESGQL
jgi:GR25 family glycosyltransferase involved in LPS biosynthesis